MRRPRLAALLPIVIAALGVGCRPAATPRQYPHAPVILISIDTLRSDHLPAYGYEKIATPALDRFAGEAVVFERAYSHYPMTLPSHVSLLTGHLPPTHGVRDNRGYHLGDELPTLASVLAEAGYRTGGVVSSAVLRRQTGLGRGFDWYDDTVGGVHDDSLRVFPQRPGSESIARARDWLEATSAGDPFFLFLHLYEPHTPYDAPEPYRSRAPSPYDAEIVYTDALLGDFFDFLRQRGLYDDTLIVVLSDHGEGLGDHGESEHGLLLYREALQVPLMIKLPGGSRGGERLTKPVGLFDVMPTLLDLLGLPAAGCEGLALLGDQPVPTDRPIYSETWFTRHQYGWSELRSAIEGHMHFIEAPRPELFDVVEDPAEREDLAPVRGVPGDLAAWVRQTGTGIEAKAEMTREELESLASLGYIGGASAEGEGAQLPDPKDHIGEVEALWAAIARIGGPDSAEAERQVLELSTTLGVRNEALFRTIAGNLLQAGRPDLALRVMEPYADSEETPTRIVVGKALTETGRLDAAMSRFGAVLQSEPDNAEAHLGMGISLLSADRAGQARSELEAAVRLDPALADAWNGLGAALARAGDLAGAERTWKRAVELDPALADTWFNLALIHRRTGKPDAAAEDLRRYSKLVEGADRQRAAAMLRELETGAR